MLSADCESSLVTDSRYVFSTAIQTLIESDRILVGNFAFYLQHAIYIRN